MQEYSEFSENEYLNTGMPKLVNNISTIASSFSGTAFPSSNLMVGMVCYRTDLKKAYRLTEFAQNSPVWKECDSADFTPGVAQLDTEGNEIPKYYAPKTSIQFETNKKGYIVMRR